MKRYFTRLCCKQSILKGLLYVCHLITNSYLMVSPTSQQTRVLDWLKDHLPKDESIQLADITSMYTVVNVIGPKAGALISELSQSDVDINVQPFTYKVSN